MPKGRQDLLTVIDEETDRLNRLVGEAAEMAQLDAQQVELRRETYPVRQVVEAALEEVKAGAGGTRSQAAPSRVVAARPH